MPGVGGKSASTAVAAWRASLGLGSAAGALPILVSQGGTGKTSLDSGKVLIGNGTDSVVFKGILNLGTKGPTSYSSSNTNPDLVTTHTLAYWDGSYSTSGASNISYVGTITKGTWHGSKIGYSYLDGVAAASHNHAASNITSGTLGVERGGTGGGSLSAARQNLFRSNLNSTAQFLIGITNNYVDGGYITLPLPLSMGGTGQANSSVSAARTNWQVPYVQKFQIAAGTVETFTFPGNLALVFARRDSDYIVGMVTVWDNTVTIISRSGSDAPAPAISTPENTRSVNVRNRRSQGAIAGMIISYD